MHSVQLLTGISSPGFIAVLHTVYTVQLLTEISSPGCVAVLHTVYTVQLLTGISSPGFVAVLHTVHSVQLLTGISYPWFCTVAVHGVHCAVLHSSSANVNGTEFLARGLASRAICYLLSPLVPGTESVLTPLFYQGNDHREKLSGKYLCVLFLLFSIIPDACVQYIHYLFLFLGPASMPSIQKFILDEKYPRIRNHHCILLTSCIT